MNKPAIRIHNHILASTLSTLLCHAMPEGWLGDFENPLQRMILCDWISKQGDISDRGVPTLRLIIFRSWKSPGKCCFFLDLSSSVDFCVSIAFRTLLYACFMIFVRKNRIVS
jgi:hypothetical protein